MFLNLNLDKKIIQNTFDGMISIAHLCYQAQEHAFPDLYKLTIIQKYKTLLTTATLPRSGRKRKLTVADKRLVVRKVRMNPKLTTKEMTNYLEASGINLSTCTIKRILHKNELKGCRARKKPLLQQRHRRARLKFARDHQDKDLTLWEHVPWYDEIKIKLFGHWA